MIPDKNGALELLRTAGCSERVVQHCLMVSDYAKEIAEKIKGNGHPVDVQLAYIGALLHDIGRSRTHDIKHGIEGARLAREYGLDNRLIRIIETHIGAGITNEEAQYLGLPPGNYMPSTLEEKIVAHADNMTEDDHIVSISTKTDILRKKGIPENIVKKIVDLNEEIAGLVHQRLS